MARRSLDIIISLLAFGIYLIVMPFFLPNAPAVGDSQTEIPILLDAALAGIFLILFIWICYCSMRFPVDIFFDMGQGLKNRMRRFEDARVRSTRFASLLLAVFIMCMAMILAVKLSRISFNNIRLPAADNSPLSVLAYVVNLPLIYAIISIVCALYFLLIAAYARLYLKIERRQAVRHGIEYWTYRVNVFFRSSEQHFVWTLRDISTGGCRLAFSKTYEHDLKEPLKSIRVRDEVYLTFRFILNATLNQFDGYVIHRMKVPQDNIAWIGIHFSENDDENVHDAQISLIERFSSLYGRKVL